MAAIGVLDRVRAGDKWRQFECDGGIPAFNTRFRDDNVGANSVRRCHDATGSSMLDPERARLPLRAGVKGAIRGACARAAARRTSRSEVA